MGEQPWGRSTVVGDGVRAAPGDRDASASMAGPFAMDATPKRIGRYVLLEQIGAGAFGRVYAAYDEDLDRKVAVKVLRTASHDAGAGARLVREAKALAQVSHPNVVAVHDVGTAGNQVFIAMEYVRGPTLTQWIEGRDATQILEMFLHAAEGLHAAHLRDIAHRDFKPDNVLVGEDGRPRVLDFGLAVIGSAHEDARGTGAPLEGPTDPGEPAEPTTGEAAVSGVETGPAGDAPGQSAQARDTQGGEASLTRTGQLLGTPRYMSPEQHSGLRAGPAADQFAFCVALWEALASEPPFEGDTLTELGVNVLDHNLRDFPSGTEVPPHVPAILAKGLSRDIGDRFESMQALAEALAPAQVKESPRGGVAAVLLVALALVAGVAALRDSTGDALCTGAEPALAEVWDEARRDGVRDGLLATEASIANDVADRIDTQLSTWTDAWIDTHTEACEATHRRGEQSEAALDRRMTCLARALVALDAATSVLTDADVEAVARADEVVAGLPAPQACTADASGSLTDAPPADEVDAVAAIEAALATSRALRSAAAFEPARASVADAVSGLEGLGYAPVRPQVWLEQARVEDALGEDESAEALLRSAQREAFSQRRLDLAREITVELMLNLGVRQLGRFDEALALEDTALGLASDDALARAQVRATASRVLRAAGRYDESLLAIQEARSILVAQVEPGDTRIVEARETEGVVLASLGQWQAAIDVQREVLEARTATLGPDHPAVGATLRQLSAASLSGARDVEAARAHAEEALRIAEATYGKDHIGVCDPLRAMGAALGAAQRFDRAETLLRRALRIAQAHHGAGHVATIGPALDLARTLRAGGKLREATALFEASMPAWEATLGAAHPEVAAGRGQYARLLTEIGRIDEALEQQRTAIADREEQGAPDSPAAGTLHNDLGLMLTQAGEMSEAKRELRTALSIWSKYPESSARDIVTASANLGVIHALEGRPTAAEAIAREALELGTERLGVDHPALSRARLILGTAIRMQGRDEEALAMSSQTLREFTEQLGETHPYTVEVRLHLATSLRGVGRFEDAVAECTKVLEIVRDGPGALAPTQDKALTCLAESRLGLGDEQGAVLALEEATASGPSGAGDIDFIARLILLGRIRHDAGQTRQALQTLEKAWDMAGARDNPRTRYLAAFGLARVLVEQPGERPRAVALARRARETFVALTKEGYARDGGLDELDAWLDAHDR